ncbi:pleckstrin homology domain-containing family G member 3 isoform X2 [Anabas testudineus]|uniref:pleckstrin homology domain-containing family G member 3 isoform X2 n=1 Tax=Anabas testudineus TaxID=64144 RepID=UPI000E45B600|nr:pleckstrin homology domain-containing family G member 3 isoform X2 [Anabas testudineus]
MPEGSHGSSNDVSMGEGGASAALLFRYLVKPSEKFLTESPRLSTASICSNERAPSATPHDSSDLPSDRRPASLISTLSSGSGSSRDNLPPLSTQASDVVIDLDLSPAGGPQANGKGRSLGLVHSNNKNNREATPNRASSRRRQSPFVTGTMAPNPQLTYLDRVVMEIIETERMYVRDLRMIVEDYLASIIDQPDLSIRPEQVCALFGNIEDIYEFNSELLQALDLCDNDPVAIARCFVMKSEYFEIYTQYCTNYPNSVAALTECMRNKLLAKFFRDRQASLKCSLPLGSYLLKPVQRILKYHLLLQEIVKHFDPEEEGYEVVEDAIYTMTAVAWYINDMKRKHEHAVRLQEVQSLLLNWKGPDLTTYGELVLEGTFKVYRAKNERTLFLFDRMLLITKRRGEHFVYKMHISCSTLMLIESAKDSLSFSVIHYKHPKQPHTVQAKTVEEKKLWAHHIKRLILENHQAIIPQKAKEAMLEKDSIYPPRYRYSPERLKKALTSQSEESHRDGRQGRRQSEQTKQTLNSTKDVSKQSGSVGVLPEERHRPLPVVSRSTLGSSLDESEAEQHAGVEEEEEELGSRKDPLHQQICSEHEEEADRLSLQQLHQTGDSELEDILLEDEQEPEGGTISSNSSNKENGQIPEEEEPGGTEPVSEQLFTHDLPQEKTSEMEPTENPVVPSADPGPGIPVFPQRSEDVIPEGDPEPTEEPASATHDSDAKTLSSSESSEDEEEEKETPPKEGEATSILPSSVLDKASAIAQHFTSSIKRGSLAQDDASCLGCSSPRLLSRTNSSLSLSLNAEGADRPVQPNSICSDPAEAFATADLTLLPPQEDNLFDATRGIHRRRESTLSKQDQLLIGKIKNYYENAGNQNATFCLQRRESLTYIPPGLVRSSVSHFNGVPKDEHAQVNLSSSVASSSLDPMLTDIRDHMVSSESLDSSNRSTDSGDLGEILRSTSQNLQDNLSEDEEFRPSSDMIKIWQAMERDITATQSEDRGLEQSKEPLRNSRETNANPTKSPNKSCDRESGVSDVCTITEESTSTSPLKHKGSERTRTESLKNTVKVFGEEALTLRAPSPRVVQLKAEAEGKRPSEKELDDVDKSNSKVLHLARQYSQRIKTTKPVVRQRSQGILMAKSSLPCVVEEKETSGKPNLTLPLVSHEKASSLPLSPIDPIRSPTASLTCRSPGSPVRGRTRSLHSPPLPIEGFNWPDVRELRSKYSDHGHSQKNPVSRSRSIPDQMCDGVRRHSSCSSSLHLTVPLYKTRGVEHGKRLHRASSLDPRLSGAHKSEMQKLQDQVANGKYDGYYVTAKAPLPNDPEHKIIVVEKLPNTESVPAEPTKEPREEEDDGYVQIRSPTSREKISIMAVIDRCRAYQESDEYKQREEAKAKTESTRPHELDKTAGSSTDQSQKTSWNSGQKTEAGQQSMVKNLREKFQNLS